ncbi:MULTISPECIES: response regulator [Ponticoccus]|uniref:Response regulator n=1 Tax=Ponticoccus litoralis TaxID=422297 RepID=A0AAW9SVD9_9RHOB
MARILIADDDADYRAAFITAMQALGHAVTGVASGQEVLPALARCPADIVFLDVLMEGGGALSTLHSLHAHDPALPVVIVTGHMELVLSPLFTEGLRLASARFHKTEPLSSFDRTVRRLTA